MTSESPYLPVITEIDRLNKERADWRAMSHWIHPDVESLSEYRIRSTLGLVEAQTFLADRCDPIPSQDQLKEAHRLAFVTTTRDAGEFRKPAQMATFGGKLGAEPGRVQVELVRLDEEVREMFDAANTPEQRCVAIGFYHARFVGIHPFRDGNGRAGRAVLAAQAEFGFGEAAPVMESIFAHRGAYLSASSLALETNDLGPIARLIGKAYGVELPDDPIPSPFKVASRRMLSLDDVKPLAIEREMARTGYDMPVLGGSPEIEI